MSALDEIRRSIEQQYRLDPNIHISVSMTRPRIKIDNQKSTITGVNPNFFQIEAQGKSYTHKYVDILMKKAFNFKAPPMPDFNELQAKEGRSDFDELIPMNDDELDFVNAAGNSDKYDGSADDIRID